MCILMSGCHSTGGKYLLRLPKYTEIQSKHYSRTLMPVLVTQINPTAHETDIRIDRPCRSCGHSDSFLDGLLRHILSLLMCFFVLCFVDLVDLLKHLPHPPHNQLPDTFACHFPSKPVPHPPPHPNYSSALSMDGHTVRHCPRYHVVNAIPHFEIIVFPWNNSTFKHVKSDQMIKALPTLKSIESKSGIFVRANIIPNEGTMLLFVSVRILRTVKTDVETKSSKRITLSISVGGVNLQNQTLTRYHLCRFYVCKKEEKNQNVR